MFLLSEFAQQIVDEIKTTINQDLNIMDKDGIIVASTDSSRKGSLHMAARDLLSQGLDSYIVESDDTPLGCKRGINLPITIDGEPVGVVGITGDSTKVAGLGKVIQKMTELMIIEIQQQAVFNYLETVRQNFIERLIFGDISDKQSLRITANTLGFDLSSPKVLVLFGPIGDSLSANIKLDAYGNDLSVFRQIQHLLKDSNCICVPINENILVLFNETKMDLIRSKANTVCQNILSYYNTKIFCGISQIAIDYTELSQKFKQALTACRAAQHYGGYSVATFNEQSLSFIIQSIPEYIMASLVNNVFSNCDDDEKEELLNTLTLYFKYGGNSAMAAKELFIHSNSFLYRLNKVKEKTHLDPRSPSDCSLLGLIVAYHNL